MNFDNFTQTLIDRLQNELPEGYRDVKFTVRENEKMNITYNALIAEIPDSVLHPALNLDHLYEMYEAGEPFDDIVGISMDAIQKDPGFDVANFMEYDKSKTFIRVGGLANNEELLTKVPHQLVEDMVLTYHYIAVKDENGIASTIITNDLLEEFGITAEQLHRDALSNSEQLFPARIENMEQVMRGMMKQSLMETGMDDVLAESMVDAALPQSETSMTVITNDVNINGAAVLFYPQVMEKLSQELDGNYFVIPSSVHECIIIPDDGKIDYKDLTRMVVEVNQTQVLPEDRLSNQVYHYDAKTHVFERADRRAERIAERNTVKDRLNSKTEQAKSQAVKPEKKNKDMSL